MKLRLIVAAVAMSAWAASSQAVVVSGTSSDGPGLDLQSQLNAITVAPSPTPGVSSVNVNTDQVANDAYWTTTGTGTSVNQFIFEIAGNAGSNTFGIFDRSNPNSYVQLFGGTNTGGDTASMTFKEDGSIFVNNVDTGINFNSSDFGYYLGSTNNSPSGSPTFFSDSSLNPNGSDQMVAYQGTNTDTVKLPGVKAGLWTNNEYILAWEDQLYANSDKDFNDLAVMVESVTPVPEPGTVALLGLGLVGLGLTRRRKAS